LSQKLEVNNSLRQMELRRDRLDQLIAASSATPRPATAPLAGPPDPVANALRLKMRELQGMLDLLEDPSRCQQQQQDLASPSSAAAVARLPQMQLLELQEQLRLQKELHLRRKELEELMKKDLMLDGLRNGGRRHHHQQQHHHQRRDLSSDSRSDLSPRSNSWYPAADSPAVSAAAPAVRRLSLSSNNNNALEDDQHRRREETNSQLRSLQAQMESLHLEVRRLNRDMVRSSSSATADEGVYDGGQRFNLMLQQQQQQIQQLTSSINQYFQTLLGVQKDVGALQRTVDSMQRDWQQQEQQQQPRRAAAERPVAAAAVARRASSISRNSNANETHGDRGARPQGSVDPWPPLVPSLGDLWDDLTQPEVVDPWPQESGAAAWHHPDSSLVSMPAGVALNNQVPAPEARANNYWDNFRSFSRQNRLSAAAVGMTPPVASQSDNQQQEEEAANGTAATVAATLPTQQGPNVAQVTPRLQASGQPSGGASATVGQWSSYANATAGHSMQGRQATVEPQQVSGAFGGQLGASSPSRPRRKQKINREQNRESPEVEVSTATSRNVVSASATATSTTSAMVHPMPQPSRRLQQPDSSTEWQHPQQGASNLGQAEANPAAVDSLTRSIFSQIGNIVSQNEQNPDRLARIYHNLQNLQADPGTAVAIARPQQDLTRENQPSQQPREATAISSPKIRRPDARSLGARTRDSAAANRASASAAAAPSRPDNFSIHNSLGEMSSILQGAAVAANNVRSDEGGAAGRVVPAQGGVVPKNARPEARRGLLNEKQLDDKPKNMQEAPQEGMIGRKKGRNDDEPEADEDDEDDDEEAAEAEAAPEDVAEADADSGGAREAESAQDEEQHFAKVSVGFGEGVRPEPPGDTSRAGRMESVSDDQPSGEDVVLVGAAAPVASVEAPSSAATAGDECEMTEADQDQSPDRSSAALAAAALVNPQGLQRHLEVADDDLVAEMLDKEDGGGELAGDADTVPAPSSTSSANPYSGQKE